MIFGGFLPAIFLCTFVRSQFYRGHCWPSSSSHAFTQHCIWMFPALDLCLILYLPNSTNQAVQHLLRTMSGSGLGRLLCHFQPSSEILKGSLVGRNGNIHLKRQVLFGLVSDSVFVKRNQNINKCSYLIFVISFTQAGFSNSKFYT